MARLGNIAILLSVLAVASIGCSPGTVSPEGAGAGGTLTVSAASDLAFAFQELGRTFEEETGTRVVFNFGSTGMLAQQVERGAPVDLFAAADLAYIEELERQGLIIPDTRVHHARGFLALWTRADSPFQVDTLEDLLRPEVRQIAIANPDHAPYGVAAREALQSAGIWDTVRPKLVLGENVRQALQYAQTGNVEVAIVARSLTSQVEGGQWVLVPAQLYNPIDQSLAVVKGTAREREARQFAQLVTSPRGRLILERYGFMPLGPEPGR